MLKVVDGNKLLGSMWLDNADQSLALDEGNLLSKPHGELVLIGIVIYSFALDVIIIKKLYRYQIQISNSSCGIIVNLVNSWIFLVFSFCNTRETL